MQEGYLKFIENPEFVKWIFESTSKAQDYWDKYINDNPGDKEDLLKAKEILLSLKKRNEVLAANEKDAIFNSVVNAIIIRSGQIARKRSLNIYFKYAAISILFFAIGSVFVYLQTNFKHEDYFEQLSKVEPTEEAKILLPDGSDIIIKSEKSQVNYTENGKIIVDCDTILTSSEIEDDALNQLIIPYGKRSNITLSDGTVVWLNAGSRLLYPSGFSDKNREVFLIGEAFFDVTKDQKRPFIVRTNDISVEVMGTQFNVTSYPDERIIQTVLTEGKIRLYGNNSLLKKEIVLSPKQMASFNKDSHETKVIYVDTEYYTLWKDGLIQFGNEDLSRVIKKIERFYNIQIKLKNPLDGMIKIDGKLDMKEDKNEVLYYVSKVAKRKYVKISERYYLIE